MSNIAKNKSTGKNRENGLAKTFGKSVIISNSIIKSDLKSENAIEFHLKRRKSQKKRPYRSIPNAIWTLFYVISLFEMKSYGIFSIFSIGLFLAIGDLI